MQLGSEETIGCTWHQPRSLLAAWCLGWPLPLCLQSFLVEHSPGKWVVGPGCHPCVPWVRRTQYGAGAVPAPGHRIHSDLHHLHSSFRSREAAWAGFVLHGPMRGVGLRCQKGGAAPAPCCGHGAPRALLPGSRFLLRRGEGMGGEGMQISAAAAAGKPGAVCRRQLRANPCLFFFPFFRQKLLKG